MLARDINSRSVIERPVSNFFIFASVLIALLINGLPWGGIWLLLRPDFVAVVLLYWCMHKPWRFGIGLSWTVGIFADVSDASLFGQHALAYTVLAYGGVVLNNRLQMFNLRQQAIHVLGILSLTYIVYASVHWMMSGHITWLYFLGCLTSTLLWIPLSILFQAMRQKRVENE